MGYSIVISEPGDADREVALDRSLEVGRHAEDVRLLDPTVSRHHLRLEVRADGVYAVDLGSRAGTSVNGEPIADARLLYPDDVIVVGETRIRIAYREDVVVPPPPVATPTVDPPPAAAPTVESVPVAPTAPAPPEPAAAPAPPAEPAASAVPPPEPSAVPEARAEPPQGAVTVPSAPRPVVEQLAAVDADGAATVRYRPGTAGERAAKPVASGAKRARRRLAGLGSEPWGVVPQICLVDPFPDPADPTRVVTDGTIVDAARNEIWMVVTAESPPEPLERPLALLFGASLPAADELAVLLEGYGSWLAGVGDADEQLAGLDLPPLHAAEGELRSVMAASFVAFLVEREKEEGLRRFLGTAMPGRVDATAQEVYGLGLTALEQAWREQLATGGPKFKTRQFLRLSLRYLRPYKFKQLEVFAYMLVALGFNVAFPFATRALFDTVLPEAVETGQFTPIAKLLTVLGLVFVISLLAGLRQAYVSAWISGAVVRDVRSNLFTKLQRLSAGWFKRHQQGDVLTRLFSDVMIVEQGLTSTLRDGIFQGLSLVVSAAVMLALNVPMGILVLLGAPLVAIVYRSMSGGAQKRGLAVQEDTGALMGVAAENYQAEPVVKLFSLQDRETERFRRLSERLFRSERRLNLFGGLFGLSVNMIVTLLRLAVLGLGTWAIIDGRFTVGGLVAFLGVMGEVLNPVTALTAIGQTVQASSGALARIDEVMDEPPEFDEPAGMPALPPVQQSLELRSVDFSYTGERQVLTEVNAFIPAGRKVAFVGPSGSGKSTTLQLLMRLYDPDEGAVLADGVDLRTVTSESLRTQLGVVFQESFLFDTTVRENIALGKPGATDEEIEAASRAAEVHDFIMTLPRGYDTVVGERGGLLSGGQRQRVAIARALVRNPRVLLLDEATSALDPKTERQITATLNRIAAGRTTVAITHRLTSVTDYDLIFVIVDGRIVEQGDHDTLVSQGGVYARLWSEQTGAPVPVAAPAAFDAVGALARLPLFAGLDPTALEDVAGRLVVGELAPGQVVEEGGGNLFLVTRGRARVVMPMMAGSSAVTAELGAGDAFGLGALLGNPSGARLEAVEVTGLAVLTDEAMQGLQAAHPTIAAALSGGGRAGAAPEGGQRLTRMTMSIRADELEAALASAAAVGAPAGAIPAAAAGVPAGPGGVG